VPCLGEPSWGLVRRGLVPAPVGHHCCYSHSSPTLPADTYPAPPPPPHRIHPGADPKTAINVPVSKMDDEYSRATVQLADNLESYFTMVGVGVCHCVMWGCGGVCGPLVGGGVFCCRSNWQRETLSAPRSPWCHSYTLNSHHSHSHAPPPPHPPPGRV